MWRKSAINQIVIAMKYFTWNYEIKYDSFNVSICINTGNTKNLHFVASSHPAIHCIELYCNARMQEQTASLEVILLQEEQKKRGEVCG